VIDFAYRRRTSIQARSGPFSTRGLLTDNPHGPHRNTSVLLANARLTRCKCAIGSPQQGHRSLSSQGVASSVIGNLLGATTAFGFDPDQIRRLPNDRTIDVSHFVGPKSRQANLGLWKVDCGQGAKITDNGDPSVP
jgi:hypothetical protein